MSAEVKIALDRLAKAQAKALKGSTWVGEKFAEASREDALWRSRSKTYSWSGQFRREHRVWLMRVSRSLLFHFLLLHLRSSIEVERRFLSFAPNSGR